MEQKSLKNRRKRVFYCTVGFVMLVAAIVMGIIFLLQGETSIENSGGDIEKNQSLTCEGDNIQYPLLSSVVAESTHLKILVTLEKEKLGSISLTYNAIYSNEEPEDTNRAKARYQLDKQFSDDGLNADAFRATYTNMEDGLQVRLFAESKDLNGVTYKYFLLEDTSGNLKRDTITKLYNQKGLDCVVNN